MPLCGVAVWGLHVATKRQRMVYPWATPGRPHPRGLPIPGIPLGEQILVNSLPLGHPMGDQFLGDPIPLPLPPPGDHTLWGPLPLGHPWATKA